MMLILGLFIIPISIFIIYKIKDIKTKHNTKLLLNILLFVISSLFIVVTFLVNKEPFKFEIQTKDDYFIYTAIIFMFTPFLWIDFFHHIGYLFKNLRIKKNAKIKDKYLYKYYRDDLNKLSPSLLMFIRNFELDDKKAISSTILKLKLTGVIEEKSGEFKIVKEKRNLLDSEKMITNLISKKTFDIKLYENQVRDEALKYGYLKKSLKNIFLKIPKLILTILIPIVIVILSVNFDNYVFSKYKFYVKDGNRYILIDDDIGDIHFDSPENIDDYYHGYIKEENRSFYDKSLINTKKFNYPIVKEAMLYHTLDLIITCIALGISFVAVYKLIEQLIFIKRNYIRTGKGTDILNKSYALKNFLEDFSDIKNKKEEELILWEYYLVYATALGVNIKINDKLIEKYVNLK